MADPDLITWVDPDGVETTLAAAAGMTVGRKAGFGMPPVALVQARSPFRPGAVTTFVEHGVRHLDVVLVPRVVDLGQPGMAELRATLRSWAYSMDPVRGAGVMRLATPAGDRQIACRYAQGMEWDEQRGNAEALLPMLVTFVCDSPYFEASADEVIGPWEQAAPGEFFPILPIEFSAATFTPQYAVTNAGDVDAEPVWTVTGPASSAVVGENLTTGESFTANVNLAAGEELVVSTVHGDRFVELNGTSVIGSFSGLLWALRPGSNTVRFTVPGSSVGTAVEGSYRPRYRTA